MIWRGAEEKTHQNASYSSGFQTIEPLLWNGFVVDETCTWWGDFAAASSDAFPGAEMFVVSFGRSGGGSTLALRSQICLVMERRQIESDGSPGRYCVSCSLLWCVRVPQSECVYLQMSPTPLVFADNNTPFAAGDSGLRKTGRRRRGGGGAPRVIRHIIKQFA